MSELNFDDLLKINIIKDINEKEKEEIVKQQMDILENVRKTERKKIQTGKRKIS
jgi:hypothetical protein